MISVQTKISKILQDPELSKTLIGVVRDTKFIVVREYMKQAPVMKGDLRRGVTATDTQGGYSVTTKARHKGRNYPLYVHEGTGKFKGSSTDYPSTGRVRSGESKLNRGSGGIRPNMFAKRAREQSKPLIMKFVQGAIDKLAEQVVEI